MEKTNVEHNVLYCWGSRLVAMVTTSDLRCVCVCVYAGKTLLEECSDGSKEISSSVSFPEHVKFKCSSCCGRRNSIRLYQTWRQFCFCLRRLRMKICFILCISEIFHIGQNLPVASKALRHHETDFLQLTFETSPDLKVDF